ncbi:MAG: ArsB/NhaD family transporter [Dehalococcoidia bacterium]|nr:ArsB/NhaD family transporter [Dehalococcoidia bacterium]
MILAVVIFAITLVLIIVRPKPLNEGTAAALGAIAILIAGVISLDDVYDVFRGTDNILLFFLGLMIISAITDQAGIFRWCAHEAVGLAQGSARRLLLVVFGLGVLITAFFSNDATALILTPIVFVLINKFKLNPLPYVFACAFMANTASMLLPVSNPVNLLAVDRFGITLAEYLKFTLLPSLAAIAINIGLFMYIFRKSIGGSFSHDDPDPPVRVDGFFLFVSTVLVLTAIGYVVTLVYGQPASWPAMGGAVTLLAGGFAFRRLRLRGVASGISWSIFIFIFGLALLVRGLENVEVTKAIGEAVVRLSSAGALWAVLAVSFITALGANLINNWSMMMVSVSSLASVNGAAAAFDRSVIYASVLGADLGPNITILGSLSSMLWLVLLRQRGLDIHQVQYIKLGLTVMPLMLIVSALCIYVCGRLFG